jgi:hypothetical protein
MFKVLSENKACGIRCMEDIRFYKKKNELPFNFADLKEGIVVRERELRKLDKYEEPIHYVVVLDTSFSSAQDLTNL